MKRVLTKNYWTEGTGSLLVAVLIALIIRWLFLEAYVIPSGSMLPSLLVNDHIFVNKMVYGVRAPFTENFLVKFSDPKRGEVIVFKYPEDMSLFYIKRVVGVPGDRVYYENGNLYINDQLIEKSVPTNLSSDFAWLEGVTSFGVPMTENHVHWQETLGDQTYSTLLQKGTSDGSTYGPYIVPKDSYFVMGDNRDGSSDSRRWAPDKRFVPRENLVGRAGFVWLSCDKMLSDKIFLLSSICNPFEVRWKRLLHSVHQ